MSKLAGKIKIEVKRLSVTDYKLKQNKKNLLQKSYLDNQTSLSFQAFQTRRQKHS